MNLIGWFSFLGHRKKKAEGKQVVVDGTASSEEDEFALQSQNGKPKAAVHLFEYEEGGPWPSSVFILPHLQDVAESLAEYVANISQDSIKHRGVFTIVLSGGSLVKVPPCKFLLILFFVF